jgi:hypothetical protein
MGEVQLTKIDSQPRSLTNTFVSCIGPLGASKNLSKENGKRKIKAIFINRLYSAKAVIN